MPRRRSSSGARFPIELDQSRSSVCCATNDNYELGHLRALNKQLLKRAAVHLCSRKCLSRFAGSCGPANTHTRFLP